MIIIGMERPKVIVGILPIMTPRELFAATFVIDYRGIGEEERPVRTQFNNSYISFCICFHNGMGVKLFDNHFASADDILHAAMLKQVE